MNTSRIKNRFHAFFFHLVCSALVAALVIVIVFWLWYPGVLAEATGVKEIFFLVLIVDVSLGPLLTLIVFDIEKKELRRDLSVILLLQAGALLYGIYTVGVVRPAYVVFAIDRFELVYANDLTKDKLNNVFGGEYKKVPLFGPKWVAAKLPENAQERNKLLFNALSGGDGLAQTPQYYFPYTELKEEVIARLRSLKELEYANSLELDNYNKFVGRYAPDNDNDNDKYGYLPLQTKTKDLAVVIDKVTAEVVDVVELNPWVN